MARFGEQRLVRPDVSAAHRLLFRLMGVPDPAHYAHWRRLRAALDTLDGFHPRAILEAGSARADHTIYLARRYPAATVLGIDIDRQFIERGRATAARLGLSNLRFEATDITELTLAAAVDLIVSIDVLEHIPRQPAALAALSRALRPGGYAFYHIPTVRTRPVPFSRHLTAFHEWAEGEHLAKELTAGEFVDAVKASGLDVVAVERTFGYWTAELATSLFALGFRDSASHRLWQALIAPFCKLLVLADSIPVGERYGVGVLARKPG